MHTRTLLLLLLMAGLVAGCTPIAPQTTSGPQETAQPAGYSFTNTARRTVTAVEMLGQVQFETGYQFQGTEVGGLSAIAYNAAAGHYYLLSDDRSERAPARIYVAAIDLTSDIFSDGDVEFLDTIQLTDADGNPFAPRSLDPEGLALSAQGRMFMTSEGDASAQPPIAPFVHEITPAGAFVRALPVPEHYLPSADATLGVRDNLAFESLTITPDGNRLVVATENALAQDGPAADLGQETLVRVIEYELESGLPAGEYVYVTESVPETPNPPNAFRTNGLAELLALDNNGTLLALERAFSEGRGNTIRLYEAQTQGALDVADMPSLFWEEEQTPFVIDPPIAKRLLLDFADLGIEPDNLEGMAFGPVLADGRQTLIVVSDNNFNQTQTTQFIALALLLTPS